MATSALTNVLSADRPDLQFCGKEASRLLAAPCVGCLQKVEGIGRYFVHRCRVVHFFGWHGMPESFSIFFDRK